MNNVVHFNMILEINQLLKQNNIEYSIHGVGGCTCCGLELRQEGKSYPTDKILEVINGYLKNHWIYVQENIEMYVRKDLPMLPALQQIQRESKNYKLGYQKTTDTVSLGRRLTKKLALRKFLYKIPAAITPSFILWICTVALFDENFENPTTLIIIFALLMILFVNIFVATEFQFSQIWLKMPLDQTMNQSVEFLRDGIRYYQFHGYFNNLKYYYGVLFNKAEKYMQFYKYEDIQSVELLLKHRYESYGTPIAKDWYVLDYRFEFKDGNHFYFYWPITLDDDSRFIGTILDEKVENIIDKDHVIEALKNGIHLNDYMKKTED